MFRRMYMSSKVPRHVSGRLREKVQLHATPPSDCSNICLFCETRLNRFTLCLYQRRVGGSNAGNSKHSGPTNLRLLDWKETQMVEKAIKPRKPSQRRNTFEGEKMDVHENKLPKSQICCKLSPHIQICICNNQRLHPSINVGKATGNIPCRKWKQTMYKRVTAHFIIMKTYLPANYLLQQRRFSSCCHRTVFQFHASPECLLLCYCM